MDIVYPPTKLTYISHRNGSSENHRLRSAGNCGRGSGDRSEGRKKNNKQTMALPTEPVGAISMVFLLAEDSSNFTLNL